MKNNPPNNDKQSLFPQTHKDINNDTFQILLQAVLCIYLTIISLYDYRTVSHYKYTEGITSSFFLSSNHSVL